MKTVNTAIKILFGVTMSGILAILLFSPAQEIYMCKKVFLLSNRYLVLIISGALILSAAIIGRHRREISLDEDKTRRVVQALCVLLFCVQMYISYNILFETGWDSRTLIKIARANAGYGKLADKGDPFNKYLSMYPNNLAIELLYSVVLKINHSIGVFPKPRDLMSIVTINAFANSLSCYLVYRIIQKISSALYGIIGFCQGVLLFGLSPWTMICYSEGLVLLFPTLIIYLYCLKTRTTRATVLKYGAIVLASCVGFLLKPYSLIVSVALLLVSVCRALALQRRRWYVIGAWTMCAILCFVGIYKLSDRAIEGILNKYFNVAIDREASFGWQHFFMMGLNESTQGVYSLEDVRLSKSFETRTERKSNNLQTAAQRVREMGFWRLMRHMRLKTLVACNDGTFAWSVEGEFYKKILDPPNDLAAPFFREIFYNTGRYYDGFGTVMQGLWLLTLVLSLAAVFMKKSRRYGMVIPIIMLTIIGLTAYEVLFEPRARHLYAYIPLFIVVSTMGLKTVLDVSKGIAGRRKLRAACRLS